MTTMTVTVTLSVNRTLLSILLLGLLASVSSTTSNDVSVVFHRQPLEPLPADKKKKKKKKRAQEKDSTKSRTGRNPINVVLLLYRGGAGAIPRAGSGGGSAAAAGARVPSRKRQRRAASSAAPSALEMWHDMLNRDISVTASISAKVSRRPSQVPPPRQRLLSGRQQEQEPRRPLGQGWFQLWQNICSDGGIPRQVGNLCHLASALLALKMAYDFVVSFRAILVAVNLQVDHVNYTPDAHVDGPVDKRWFTDALCATCNYSHGQYAYGNMALAALVQFVWYACRGPLQRRGPSLQREYLRSNLPLVLLGFALIRGALEALQKDGDWNNVFLSSFFSFFTTASSSSSSSLSSLSFSKLLAARVVAGALYALPMLLLYAVAAPQFSHYDAAAAAASWNRQEQQQQDNDKNNNDNLQAISQRATNVVMLGAIVGSAIALVRHKPFLDMQLGFSFVGVWITAACSVVRLLCYPAAEKKKLEYMWNAILCSLGVHALTYTMGTHCRQTPLLRTMTFLDPLGAIWFEGYWALSHLLVWLLCWMGIRPTTPTFRNPPPPPAPAPRGVKVIEFRR